MNAHLKIKIKSLAAESTFIRQSEEKWRERARKARLKEKDRQLANAVATEHSLYQHRYHVVRPETRASHLAYGFLRGQTYQRMENLAYREPDWKRVEEIAKKFGVLEWTTLGQKFAQWKDEAHEHFTAEKVSKSTT